MVSPPPLSLSVSAEELMWCYMNSLLITFLGYLVVQTCVFHSYMNLAAELLRFADREFYLVRITSYSESWWRCMPCAS